MYCSSCREERLGLARFCVVCGLKLSPRALAEVEAELAHVQYLLGEVSGWDVKQAVKDYLTERYQRRERLLRTSIEERASHAPAGSTLAEQPTRTPSLRPDTAPVPSTASDAAPVPAVSGLPAEAQPPDAQATVLAFPTPEKAPPSPAVYASRRDAARTQAEAQGPSSTEDAASSKVKPPSPVPLPGLPLPAFEVPESQDPEQQVLEEASTWNRIWKPFLYESVGWFIGGFLILAGTFYFVAESWAGMTSLLRSLVVFALTAGYAAGFSLWGGLLLRKETLAGAGRILQLIGAAVAPLTAIALQPLAQEHAVWLWPLAALAGVGAARRARASAMSFEAPAPEALQALAFLATAMLGLAPLVAQGGPRVVWLSLLPIGFLWRALDLREVSDESRTAPAFAYLAPAYLLLLFGVSLHLGLMQAGQAPHLGDYAPFLAAIAGLALRLRRLEAERSADALALGVVAAQVACVVLSAQGAPPAFFVTSTALAFTTWTLSQGALPRLRWLYAGHAAGYLAYQSAGQLVPGPLLTLLERVRQALGYGEKQSLPFSFAAVYAVPYVVGGAVLAVRALRRAEQPDAPSPEQSRAFAEVLLRATAGASLAFMALALSSKDPRPALWTVPTLAWVCTGLGLWVDRRYLTWTGIVGALVTPVFTVPMLGLPFTAVACGAGALGYAFLVRVLPSRERHGQAVAVCALSAVALVTGVLPPWHLASPFGLLLAAAAVGLLAYARDEERLWPASAVLVACAVCVGALAEVPPFAPLALAVTGLAFAVLSDRIITLQPLRSVALLANVAAVPWEMGFQFRHEALSTPWHLGLVLLLGVASATVCALEVPALGALGALFLGPALLPLTELGCWPGLVVTPEVSVGLYAGLAVAASAWTFYRGRSLAASWHAGVGLVCTAAVLAWVSVGQPPHPHPWPLFGVAAMAALASSRALDARFCIAWAAALAAVFFVQFNGLFLVAGLLTVVALADEVPSVRDRLLGPVRVGLTASVCALLACGAGVAMGHSPGGLAAAFLLPLLWTRASRRPAFLLATPVLVGGLMARGAGVSEVAGWGLLAFVVGVSRAAFHLPAARRGLLGQDAEAHAAWVPRFPVLALAGVGLLLHFGKIRLSLPGGSEGDPSVLPAALSVAMLMSAGGPLALRLGAAAAFAFLSPPAWGAATLVLLATALCCHHFPARAAPALGVEEAGHARPAATLLALGLSFLPYFQQGPRLPAFLLNVATVFLAAFLLGIEGPLAAVPLLLGHAVSGRLLTVSSLATPAMALVALGAALLSVASLRESVRQRLQTFSRWLGPGLSDFDEPWWLGAALPTGLAIVPGFFGWMAIPPLSAALFAGVAGVLLISVSQAQSVTATLLLGASLALAVPAPWTPVGVALAGTGLCLAGYLLETRFDAGRTLHFLGFGLALASLVGLKHLGHVSTPLTVLLCTTCAWISARRKAAVEPLAWGATLVFAHVLVFHLGVVYSTGKPPGFVFPYLALVSALGAAVVLSLQHREDRFRVGLAFATVSLLETLGGLSTIAGQASREAVVGVVSQGLLFTVLVRAAVKQKHEGAAQLAQGALALGYLVVRLHGMGASSLEGGDSLAALVAGAVASGLHAWTQRQGEALRVFVRPSLTGAFLLPLLGLWVAPWRESLLSAALLVGYAAHFAALSVQSSMRRSAALLAALSFNGALWLLWRGTGAGEPQYYIIPAGISLIGLVWLFRDELGELWEARLRAVAISAIYGAAAWRPLMFDAGWAMVLCAFVCVVGVAVGVAMRIRSYVYLGTTFLVTTVVANMVRYGARDHRLGALFLSGLGLLVVGFMVVMTSQREQLLKRYQRVKQMLEGWQG